MPAASESALCRGGGAAKARYAGNTRHAMPMAAHVIIKAARNFPRTTWASVTGALISVSMVPEERSCAKRFIVNIAAGMHIAIRSCVQRMAGRGSVVPVELRNAAANSRPVAAV